MRRRLYYKTWRNNTHLVTDKDKNKKFYRETNTSYRFRNIPKTKFIKGTYKTKKINNNVSIVFGQLKPENEHLEGSGLTDFFKNSFFWIF